MRTGIRVGKLFGIELRIDWSWTFIFLLLTWNLTAVFGRWHPDWGIGLSLTIAIASSLLFFVSVLAHEMAHSLVAKAQGVQVRSITLWLFGGVSSFEREPPSPRVEFLSAIVGPLTSLVLGGAFLVLGGMSVAPLVRAGAEPQRVFAALGPIPTLLLWLGPINILLALFNMIPAFPLDGGRVLRSALWAATRDLRKATRWASGLGQGIAWLFIAMGFAMVFGLRVPVFGTGLLSGLWLAFIGWFLANASSQSYRQVVIQDLLGDVPVARLMRTDVPTVESGLPLTQLVNDWILGTEDRAFPVMRNGAFVGLVCLQDVRRVPNSAWDTTTVEQVMTPADRLATIGPDEDAAEALMRLARRDVGQLPVVRNGQLLGMLRMRELTRWLEIQSDPEMRGRHAPA